MDEKKRVHVIYSGRVQGVGFRFTAESLALRTRVTGFVKNNSDGTVEIVCEGPHGHVQSFLDGINEALADYIYDSKIEWQSASGEFGTFEIRF